MSEIVQSTEHSIEETFVRLGSGEKIAGVPREEDLTGELKIRIDSPTAPYLRIFMKDFNAPTGPARYESAFDISIEGAAALRSALARILNWRQVHVNEESKAAANAPQEACHACGGSGTVLDTTDPCPDCCGTGIAGTTAHLIEGDQ